MVLLAACESTPKPEIKYVERIVETKVKSPIQYRQLCHIDYLEAVPANAQDIIVLANKNKNNLIICNEIIQKRNEYEDKIWLGFDKCLLSL